MKPREHGTGTEWTTEEVELLQIGMRRHELFFPKRDRPTLPEDHVTGEGLDMDIPESMKAARMFDDLASRTEDWVVKVGEEYESAARGARPIGGRKIPKAILGLELEKAKQSLAEDREMATEIFGHIRASRQQSRSNTL